MICWPAKEDDEDFKFGSCYLSLIEYDEDNKFTWGHSWNIHLAKIEGGGLRFKAYALQTTPCERWASSKSSVEGEISTSYGLTIQRNDIPEDDKVRDLFLSEFGEFVSRSGEDFGELHWRMLSTLPPE